MSAIRVGDHVTWKSAAPFTPADAWTRTHAVWRVEEIYASYGGRIARLHHLRRNGSDHYSVDLLRPLTGRERTLAGIDRRLGQGTTSSSPGRSYTVGLPVTVTVHDDGTVTADLHVEDLVEAIADCDLADYLDDGDVVEPTDDVLAQQVADSEAAGRAATLTTYPVIID